MLDQSRKKNSELESRLRSQTKELKRSTESLQDEKSKNSVLQGELREAKEGWAAEMKEMSTVIQELREEVSAHIELGEQN